MRVLFSTTAGAGHFAPVIPFARACLQAGHDVRVAAPRSFASTVIGAGFDHAPFNDADPDQLSAVFSQLHLGTVQEANMRVMRDVFARIDSTAALPGLHAIVDDWRPEVIVAEAAEFGSAVIAEQHGIRQLRVNIGLDGFTEHILDAVDEPLRELGGGTGSNSARSAPRLSLLPARFDQASGPSAVHRFRDRDAGGAGSELPTHWWPDEHFAKPMVYVTFGSVAGHLGFYPAFYRRVVDCLGELPVRVLMTLGAGLDPADLGAVPPNVHLESWVAQDDVLGEASIVVSHGGFGTLVGALAHGRPQVVIPLFSADQYVNADRVAATGIGRSLSPGDPESLRSADLVPAGPDVSRLGDVLTQSLADDELAQAAARTAAELNALPPAAEFLALLATPS